MKALALMGPRALEVIALPDAREPGPGEALVRVTAVGVCGTDLHYYRGETGGTDPLEPGFVMGHEFAGVVEAVGAGVTRVRAGDRVAVDPAIACGECELCIDGHPHVCPRVRFVGSPGVPGALRERLVHPAHLLHPLPPAVSDTAGALLEPLGVALHALDLAAPRVADVVAVLGCGPIGLLLVQLARVAGAQAVLATDLHDYRLRLAKTAGATATFNAARENPVAAMLDATGGHGADVVFEAAGAPETPDQAARVAAALGTVVVVGICADNRTAFTATPARRKGLTVKIARRMKPIYPRTIALAAHGMVDLETFVSHRVPLEGAPRAFQALAGYHEDAAKVVIAPA
jgi:L-iditol 2-dehydrogenase